MTSTILVFFLVFLISKSTVFAQGGNNDWLCESLICDPPKKCVLVDEVAQCLVDSNPTPTPFGTINGGQPLFPQQPFPSNPSPPSPSPSPFSFQTVPPPPPTLIPESAIPTIVTTPTPTTPPNPLAPFLNLFNPQGGTPATLLPPFTLPTLPTLPTTPSPSTQPPIDICSLPPITGSCSRARIMWYYDTETRRCERFSWSGCGNENRFSSKMQCEQTCSQSSLFRKSN